MSEIVTIVGELSLPWVVTVIGVHFPLAWAFRAPFFDALGAGLTLPAFAARPALVVASSDQD